MEKEASCAVRPHCSFSSTENLCRILDDAGVPDDPHWRSFILYARNLNDHNYLTHRQRARMQSMVLRVLQEKDFSDAKFNLLLEENHRILSAPYREQLQGAVEESKSLLREFTTILHSRRGDISNLGDQVIEALEKGTEPKEMIAALRIAFNKVIDTIREDTEQLEVLVRTDALTSLYNRRAFDERLDLDVASAVKEGTGLSLLLVDIDHFKVINDAYGHRIGDQALAAVAGHIRDYCTASRENGEQDIFPARYGGEEFGIILPRTGSEVALQFAEGLCKTVEQNHFVIKDTQGTIVKTNFRITVSIGTGTLGPNWSGDLRAALIDAADAGLYAAKSKGRNRVEAGL